ncbi:MAG: AAA family ATPase [Acidobacteriaceae bacterium]
MTTHLQHWDVQPDTRWKSTVGTSRNQKAIHDLTAAETQFKVEAANEIARDGRNSSAITRLQAGTSPLDRVNGLLKQSQLPVSVLIETAELKATRGNGTYSIARMSDGERIALVLIAEVVTAPIGSVFLIDEPELHMHRAIVVPLISSLMRENPESTFIISTHELELLASCPQSSIAIIRSCSWNGPNISEWELDTIPQANELPEDVRLDVLGSRRKVLFVEGVTTSLDGPLYALLFPTTSIRSRESCREVERAVSGLRAIQNMHHAEAFGLIDGDSMGEEQKATFVSKGIYPLPVHAVESLYYSEEVLKAIAERQANTLGLDQHALLHEARTKAVDALNNKDCIEHLASRVVERQLRDSLLQHLPTRTELMNENMADITVSLASPFPKEVARLRLLLNDSGIATVISRYPVRESGILEALAKGLRFSGRADYERAVLTRLSTDATLCDALRAKLVGLASQLD